MKTESKKGWGYFGGICTTFAFLPQIIKILISKETKDISLGMYIILATGVALWIVHGYKNKDNPVMIFNGITLAFAVVVLYLKIQYG